MHRRSFRSPTAKPEPMVTSVSLADFCCLEHALKACQRAWGVVLTVGIELDTDPAHFNALVMAVRMPNAQHQAELNGFPGFTNELYPLSMVDMEVQMVSGLLGWVIAVEDHMKR